MPDNFIPAMGQERGQRIARNIGGGIASGLHDLLEHKAKTMRLENIGIAPHHAAYIASLPAKEQFEAVKLYNGQGVQGQPQGQAIQGAQGPQMGGTPPGQGQQQGFQNPFGGGQTPAQLKHADAIVSGQQNLEDIIRTTDSMREILKSKKVGSGVISTLGAKFAPNWLGKETELFDKESAHIVNLTSADLKGVPSVFRVKLIEKEKPGVQHSYAVNQQILDRLNRDARAKLETLQRRNPWLAQYNNQEGLGASQEQGQFAPGQTEQQQEAQAPDESLGGQLVRGGVRTAARVGEAIAGTPGDILGAGAGLANYVTGGSFPSYGQIQEKLPISFPTSEQLKEFTGKATGGYTNPQGGIEEGIDSAVQTFASLFLPSKLKPSVVSNLTKVLNPTATKIASNVILPFSGVGWKQAAAMTVAGEAAEGVASGLGAGPLGKASAKLVAMALAGTAGGQRALNNTMTTAYDDAKKSISGKPSASTTVNGRGLAKDISEFQNRLNRSSLPNKEIVQEIVNDVKNGLNAASERTYKLRDKSLFKKIHIADIIQQKKDLNEWLKLKDYQGVSGQRFLPEGARPWVNDLAQIFRKRLSKYAEIHPSFGKPYQLAEDIFKGLNDVDVINEFLQKNASTSIGLKSYLGKALLIGGIGTGVSTLARMGNQIIQHPEIQRYYRDAVIAAAKNSLPEFKRVAAKLDKEAYRIEKERGY